MDMLRPLLAFDALGHPSRLAVFGLRVQTMPAGLAAGDIARQLNLRPNTLSAHPAQLQTAGLIVPKRDGSSIGYSANMTGGRGLLSWLLQDCCGGSPKICAPVLDRIARAC